jgi:hypothetical protein
MEWWGGGDCIALHCIGIDDDDYKMISRHFVNAWRVSLGAYRSVLASI